MQLVASISKFTCALACLESFSRDAGLFYMQAELMKYHPRSCLDPAKSHEFGAVSAAQLDSLCAALDLNPQTVDNPTFDVLAAVLTKLAPFQTVLFFVGNYQKSGTCHTVRYCSIAGVERLRVMCPYFGVARFEEVEWADLLAGGVKVFVLSKGTH